MRSILKIYIIIVDKVLKYICQKLKSFNFNFKLINNRVEYILSGVDKI